VNPLKILVLLVSIDAILKTPVGFAWTLEPQISTNWRLLSSNTFDNDKNYGESWNENRNNYAVQAVSGLLADKIKLGVGMSLVTGAVHESPLTFYGQKKSLIHYRTYQINTSFRQSLSDRMFIRFNFFGGPSYLTAYEDTSVGASNKGEPAKNPISYHGSSPGSEIGLSSDVIVNMNRKSIVFLGLEWSMQKYSFDANSYGNSSHQIKHKNVKQIN
jgi:hypothetical protein